MGGMDPVALDNAAVKAEAVARVLDEREIDTSTMLDAQRGTFDGLDEEWDGLAQASFYGEWGDEARGTGLFVGLLDDVAHRLRTLARGLRARAAEEREQQRREEERRREAESGW